MDVTVVSGLAAGIDTAAHAGALMAGGRSFAVIGTPISECYPKQNLRLQEYLASTQLVVSPVPFVRYSKQGPRLNRFFFPERNKVMSALTEATVIVEASETSGTLVQARAALDQGRKLFIMDNCFERTDITWPRRFLERGAIRLSEFEQLTDVLG
jgi:DNA processing protein